MTTNTNNEKPKSKYCQAHNGKDVEKQIHVLNTTK